MQNEAPNLDAMHTDDLWEFWKTHQNGRKYRDLFPAGGTGSKRAAGDLACYASNKATAQGLRVKGDIQRAIVYEDICQRIYDRLPEFARW
jgi:hypothetical protein